MRGVSLLALVAASSATTFTLHNACNYTVYPGLYPAATFANGGFELPSGQAVSFGVSGQGRLWGRTECNTASTNGPPAQCATGSCGGVGIQCAGTTGQPNTALFEWNLNAQGTDWYDVSYVDAIDNPIGVTISNGACVSPSQCSRQVIANCPEGLRTDTGACESPCTRYNTDQFCCRGAYGTSQTCVVADWEPSAQAYVTNIHTFCPHEYAYAYDDPNGLHTCQTGSDFTITFCP